MYRLRDGKVEAFIAHPGGPYFARKDEGYWTIPKGEVHKSEDLLETAKREFEEEVGVKPHGPYTSLGTIVQKGGKIVHAWCFEGELDPGAAHISNTYEMEWPPGSGKMQQFPEIDRVGFFPLREARRKLKPTQVELLDRLEKLLKC